MILYVLLAAFLPFDEVSRTAAHHRHGRKKEEASPEPGVSVPAKQTTMSALFRKIQNAEFSYPR